MPPTQGNIAPSLRALLDRMEESTQNEATLLEALVGTDRCLRRLFRNLNESNPNPDDGLERELKLARRQLRRNRELLGPSPGRTEPSSD
jgi:hypothetical protein